MLLFFQLRNLDEIQSNFRVKEVYCQKNSLDDVTGLKKFKFLTTLLIGDNQLRDLDKFLDFLQHFSFLT